VVSRIEGVGPVAIYAIGDLHLSQAQAKPMDIFGNQWLGHTDRLSENWLEVVNEKDLVIVAGDISWAMHLSEALPDLNWLANLPGIKMLIRGNHDYWWSTIGKVRAALPPSVHVLQNDHFSWNGWSICGTRGWICPGEDGFDSEQDQKIYLREVQRLKLSLLSAAKNAPDPIIAALHFPPFNRKNQPSAFSNLLEEYKVRKCLFGHIHDSGRDNIFQGVRNGIEYHFVAADGLNFRPKLLVE
jgi:uncharacterized protein